MNIFLEYCLLDPSKNGFLTQNAIENFTYKLVFDRQETRVWGRMVAPLEWKLTGRPGASKSITEPFHITKKHVVCY